jgi:hypothetical protein
MKSSFKKVASCVLKTTRFNQRKRWLKEKFKNVATNYFSGLSTHVIMRVIASSLIEGKSRGLAILVVLSKELSCYCFTLGRRVQKKNRTKRRI